MGHAHGEQSQHVKYLPLQDISQLILKMYGINIGLKLQNYHQKNNLLCI